MSSSPTTTAVDTICRCGAHVLVAIDDGIPAKVDHSPVDPTTPGLTYIRTTRGHLVYRNPDQGQQPAGPVYADHQCHPAPPADPPLTLF